MGFSISKVRSSTSLRGDMSSFSVVTVKWAKSLRLNLVYSRHVVSASLPPAVTGFSFFYDEDSSDEAG
jgi:hypothetical protein